MKKVFAIIGISLLLMISVVPLVVSAYDPADYQSVYEVSVDNFIDVANIEGSGYIYQGSAISIHISTSVGETSLSPEYYVDQTFSSVTRLSVVYDSGTDWFEISVTSGGSTTSYNLADNDLQQSVRMVISVDQSLDISTLFNVDTLEFFVADGYVPLAPDPDPEPDPDTSGGSPVDRVTEVFSEVGDWIVDSLGSLSEAFWADGSLTLLGTLAVCGLGIAVCLLVISLICKWLKFGG